MTADGTGVVAHAGECGGAAAGRPGRADRGAVGGVGPALVRARSMTGAGCWSTWRRCCVAGGEAIGDIDTLRHQSEVFGSVASAPTVWRALDELTPAALSRVEKARARTRARVWALLPGGVPASRVAGGNLGQDVVVLDVDATIVVAHSEKEQAAADVQGHLRVPPDRGLVRQHRRAAGRRAAAGQRRLEHHRRPPRGPDRGDRPGPGRAPPAAAGPRRRRRRLPRPAGLAHRPEHAERGRHGGVFGRVRGHRDRSATRSPRPQDARGRPRSTPTATSASTPTSPRSPACST